jgi:glycosyltransferase involved in cell wall biosynthesis
MSQPLDPIKGPWTGPRPPVSVVILTLDEEANIGPCLASCAWADDVHVLDSGSTDSTVEIARSLGATVHTNPFASFAQQRNWAIDHILLRNDWVLHLDADERCTEQLILEIDRLLAKSPREAGFYIASQMIFMETWIRRASGYPAYQVRLFHRSRMRFVDHGHGQREDGRGPFGRLQHPYLHFNFAKGLNDWYERHNRYSTLEARQIVNGGSARASPAHLLTRDPVARRRALKALAGILPCRPTLRRLHVLFIQGAILEGRPGRTYAALLAAYEQMIQLKVRSMRAEAAHRKSGRHQ